MRWDAASNDVQVMTVGQYLRPTENHLPIVRYWHPDEFRALEEAAYEPASSMSPPARWCDRATTRNSTSPRRNPESGR